MTSILTDTAQTALWHDLVRDAERGASTRLDDELESYLVFMLMRHTRDAQLGGHVFAVDFLLALEQRGAQREQELREIGDRCLLVAGLYPEQAQRRLVTLDYFLALGSHAYDELSAALKAALADLYHHLAQAFARMVRVLMELRSQTRDVAPLLLHEIAVAHAAHVDHAFPGAVLLGADNTQH